MKSHQKKYIVNWIKLFYWFFASFTCFSNSGGLQAVMILKVRVPENWICFLLRFQTRNKMCLIVLIELTKIKLLDTLSKAFHHEIISTLNNQRTIIDFNYNFQQWFSAVSEMDWQQKHRFHIGWKMLDLFVWFQYPPKVRRISFCTFCLFLLFRFLNRTSQKIYTNKLAFQICCSFLW